MISFIKLLRPLNLFIIVITMYAVRFGIIMTMIDGQYLGMQLKYPEWKFALSVLVMVLLAASGNIINDYFDVRVDRINKPDRVIVGKTVKRRVAMVTHHAFNILAVGITGYLAYDVGIWFLIAVPIIIAGGLWFYSLSFKKEPFIGNFVVAVLVGFVPIWAGVFEMPVLSAFYSRFAGGPKVLFTTTWNHILILAAFAFLLTLVREALKDMEDIEGDSKLGFKTLPIKLGLNFTKTYAVVLISIVLAVAVSIGNHINQLTQHNFQLMLLVGIVIIPLFVAIYRTIKSREKRDFSGASLWLKIAMIGGIIFTFFLNYLLINS